MIAEFHLNRAVLPQDFEFCVFRCCISPRIPHTAMTFSFYNGEMSESSLMMFNPGVLNRRVSHAHESSTSVLLSPSPASFSLFIAVKSDPPVHLM